MLWTIFVVLLVLWLLGFVGFHVLGSFIHILLLIALVVLILQLIQGPARLNEACRDCRNTPRRHRVGDFCHGGIHWTEHKQDAKLGPLEISHNEEHGVSFPPIAGGLCVVGGVVLLAVGGRK